MSRIISAAASTFSGVSLGVSKLSGHPLLKSVRGRSLEETFSASGLIRDASFKFTSLHEESYMTL